MADGGVFVVLVVLHWMYPLHGVILSYHFDDITFRVPREIIGIPKTCLHLPIVVNDKYG